MLRITTHGDRESLTFQLEGKMAGAWVAELEKCRQRVMADTPKSFVCFDLAGVTYVDSAGKEFLATRFAQGDKLIAADCLMRAVIMEITGEPDFDCDESAKKIGNPELSSRK
jgi:anti-anti-sigma regulatory factor